MGRSERRAGVGTRSGWSLRGPSAEGRPGSGGCSSGPDCGPRGNTGAGSGAGTIPSNGGSGTTSAWPGRSSRRSRAGGSPRGAAPRHRLRQRAGRRVPGRAGFSRRRRGLLEVGARDGAAPLPGVAGPARVPRGRRVPDAPAWRRLRSPHRLRCYHQIPPEDRRAYWRTIARAADPGARLLLTSTAFRGRRPPGDPVEIQRATAVIEDGQDGAFAIERVTETVFEPYPGSIRIGRAPA